VPEVNSVQRTEVRAAIARASAATGVDFDYLLAQAKIESGLQPTARAATSSAGGLYQFTTGTWLETLDRHGAKYGLAVGRRRNRPQRRSRGGHRSVDA
jgi:soluble lytic murein transglycosylase-like protein